MSTEAQRSAERAHDGRSRVWRALGNVLSFALVAIVFLVVLPRVADYGEVWSAITSTTWLESLSIGLLAAWNVYTYVLVWTAVLPRLRRREAFVVINASTAAANTLPGGAAIGVGVTYAMLRSWGFTPSEFARTAVVTNVFQTFVKLGLPILTVALLAMSDEVEPGLAAAAVFGVGALIAAIIVFALILRTEGFARSVGDLFGRWVSAMRRFLGKTPVTGWGDGFRRFRLQTAELLRSRWLRISWTTLVSQMTLYLLLLASLRVVGVSSSEVGWLHVLAAFAFVRLLTALPLTPGGLGVVELGLTAALAVGAASSARDEIVAGVLLYRVLTFVLPIVLGAGTYLFWRANQTWRAPESAA